MDENEKQLYQFITHRIVLAVCTLFLCLLGGCIVSHLDDVLQKRATIDQVTAVKDEYAQRLVALKDTIGSLSIGDDKTDNILECNYKMALIQAIVHGDTNAIPKVMEEAMKRE